MPYRTSHRAAPRTLVVDGTSRGRAALEVGGGFVSVVAWQSWWEGQDTEVAPIGAVLLGLFLTWRFVRVLGGTTTLTSDGVTLGIHRMEGERQEIAVEDVVRARAYTPPGARAPRLSLMSRTGAEIVLVDECRGGATRAEAMAERIMRFLAGE